MATTESGRLLEDIGELFHKYPNQPLTFTTIDTELPDETEHIRRGLKQLVDDEKLDCKVVNGSRCYWPIS